MRAEKSVKNVMVGWFMQILIIVGGFVCRTIFISVLNEEYLGLSGLFSNILTMLSLAELGVGTAIVFSLYKPIALDDKPTMMALMDFYRKFYKIVGCFVLVVGSLLAPLLPHLIKDMPDIPHIYFIYLLYVLNTGVSYFFSYKAAFVNANQENFITSLNHGICSVVMMVLQVIVLFTTRSFILYFTMQILATLTENIIISNVANKRYPMLKEKNTHKLSPALLSEIKKNTFAMIGHNVGTIVLTSTDNMVISKFVGLAEVGIYSNYTLLINSVNQLLGQAFTAITSSVGNLLVEGSEEDKENTFYMVYFVNFWFYAFSATALYCLLNPFIKLWVGDKYEFTPMIVAVIVMNFYCVGIRQACNVFKSAAGLFMQDVYKPYVEVVVNLIISIVLVQKYGIIGVLLGTLISTLAVVTWIEPMVLYKYGFKKKPWKYFALYLIYAATTLGCSVVTNLICERLAGDTLLGFILKIIIVLLVPNLLILVLYGWTKDFKRLLTTLKVVFLKRS